MRKYRLPKLPSGEFDYYWVVGEDVGHVPETSGIRREYGFETRPTFGVSINRDRSFLRIFKWVEVMAYSNFPVSRDRRSVNKAAQYVFNNWQESIKLKARGKNEN